MLSVNAWYVGSGMDCAAHLRACSPFCLLSLCPLLSIGDLSLIELQLLVGLRLYKMPIFHFILPHPVSAFGWAYIGPAAHWRPALFLFIVIVSLKVV